MAYLGDSNTGDHLAELRVTQGQQIDGE